MTLDDLEQWYTVTGLCIASCGNNVLGYRAHGVNAQNATSYVN